MIYHSHWRQRTSRCLWRYGGSSCTRGQWFQNQTRPTRTSEPNRENKHCWWKPDKRQTEVWRGSAPSLEVSRRVTQTQKPSHLLQSGYEEHGQSHQMQHGYGDQQEDHGCLEMWENPWNSVYRQRNDLLSGPTGFRGRTQFLCLREPTSLSCLTWSAYLQWLSGETVASLILQHLPRRSRRIFKRKWVGQRPSPCPLSEADIHWGLSSV